MLRRLTAVSICKCLKSGGEIGIRTLDTRKRILDFESSAFDHSAISPRAAIIACRNRAPPQPAYRTGAKRRRPYTYMLSVATTYPIFVASPTARRHAIADPRHIAFADNDLDQPNWCAAFLCGAHC